MNRNLATILLLICSVLVLIGGAVLYFTLSSAGSEAVAPATPAATVEPAQPGTPEEEGVIDVNENPAEPGSSAEIIPDDSNLDPAVDFVFTDRSGVEHHLSEYYGKPIIINFWATWCGPCQMELPHFNRAYAQYQGQIQFMMMDLVDGSYETEASTIAFVDSEGYTFPLFFDVKGEGSLAYEIEAIPLTVVISANGRILATHLGSMSESELQELIDLALNR